MKKYAFAILVLATILVSTLFASVSASIVVNAPRSRIDDSTSSNWSGYAIQTNLNHPAKNVVTDVQGSWVVPAVTGSSGTTTYSSFWVGIDGYSDSTVEQIGTDSDIINGVPTYYAWYEMYPAYPVNLGLTINPGDSITAEVNYASNSFILSITDTTPSGVTHTFSTSISSSSSIQRSSAEWIAEAPWSGGVLPLANFGTVTFTGCSATISGHTGFISDSNWKYDAITMASGAGKHAITKAQPSPLDLATSGFSVRWFHQ
jgi:hypothetical protein